MCADYQLSVMSIKREFVVVIRRQWFIMHKYLVCVSHRSSYCGCMIARKSAFLLFRTTTATTATTTTTARTTTTTKQKREATASTTAHQKRKNKHKHKHKHKHKIKATIDDSSTQNILTYADQAACRKPQLV